MHNTIIAIFLSGMLLVAPNCFAYVAPGRYHDYRSNKLSAEIQRMQEFHLEQAKIKINKQQLKHAWGDLAYLLCQVPNHHLALRQMLILSPQLHKETELRTYLSKAMQLFPEDAVVQMLYGIFLHNMGEKEGATKHLDLAKKYGDLNVNDQLLNNSAVTPQ